MEGAARQRLVDELEVPAWEALVLVVGRVSCSRKEVNVGGHCPSGDGEVSINPAGNCNFWIALELSGGERGVSASWELIYHKLIGCTAA